MILPEFIDIVFDGPPGPQGGRFVETEDAEGASISVGEWLDRGNGYWALRIAPHADTVWRVTHEDVDELAGRPVADEDVDKIAGILAWSPTLRAVLETAVLAVCGPRHTEDGGES